MVKKIFISLILIFAILFFTKDTALKIAVNYYLKKNLKAEALVESCKLSLRNLTIRGARFSDRDFFLYLPALKIKFNLGQLLGPQQLEITAGDISLSINKDDFLFNGSFDAFFFLKLKGWQLEELNGELVSVKDGLIQVKSESALQALRRNLDENSYQALTKGFQNYTYNQGRIALAKEGNLLSIDLNFDSQTAGKRNITVNWHNL